MRRKAHASGPPPTSTVTPPSSSASTTPAAGDEDWTTEALDRIDQVIEKVRSNTTDRLVRIARLVVFGLLAAIMGGTAGVLATIALVRALDEAIPGQVWVVYLLLGAILTAGGAFLWSQRTPKTARS